VCAPFGNAMSANKRILEIDAKGLKLKTEEESLFGGETKELVTDEVGWERFPLRNIGIKGLSEIDAEFDNSGETLKSVKFRVDGINRKEKETENFFEKLTEETGIKYNQSTNDFEFNESYNDKSNFINFVEFLFNEGYIQKSDLPYATSRADKAYLLNTEPLDQEGDEMERVGEPVDGVYTPTHYAKRFKKNYMRLLINEFVDNYYIGD
jgi:hypothetical protein